MVSDAAREQFRAVFFDGGQPTNSPMVVRTALKSPCWGANFHARRLFDFLNEPRTGLTSVLAEKLIGRIAGKPILHEMLSWNTHFQEHVPDAFDHGFRARNVKMRLLEIGDIS